MSRNDNPGQGDFECLSIDRKKKSRKKPYDTGKFNSFQSGCETKRYDWWRIVFYLYKDKPDFCRFSIYVMNRIRTHFIIYLTSRLVTPLSNRPGEHVTVRLKILHDMFLVQFAAG